MAAEIGWPDLDSMLAANLINSVFETPFSPLTSVTDGFPIVRVPVLSNAMTFTLLTTSRYLPPLKTVPLRAAFAMAATTATGTDSARPQEQETTNTTSPRSMNGRHAAPKNRGGIVATRIPRRNISGV